MEIGISAARFVVSRALVPVSDGLLESWAACSELGPNVRALKLELLYAQGMLDSALGRDVRDRYVRGRYARNPALGQLLLELRHHADSAEDVLDELDYFRIQDELEKTHETGDDAQGGLIGGLVRNARHTARDVVNSSGHYQRKGKPSNFTDDVISEALSCHLVAAQGQPQEFTSNARCQV